MTLSMTLVCLAFYLMLISSANTGVLYIFYRMGQKMWHFTFVHIFANY